DCAKACSVWPARKKLVRTKPVTDKVSELRMCCPCRNARRSRCSPLTPQRCANLTGAVSAGLDENECSLAEKEIETEQLASSDWCLTLHAWAARIDRRGA